MKPIKLVFKGINSFSERTEIDFAALTKSGIFGIFGDTGSGKSTILDCINYALYGKVERSKEKNDIINLRCDGAEVAFDFDVMAHGKRKNYCVERSMKRKAGTSKATLYEDGICIADNVTTVTQKITEILGVDAEDFRKCIALPQGEFAQFVKSQAGERISLIERLFSLSKYGDRLKEKIKNLETETEIEIAEFNARLMGYGNLTEEFLSQSKDEISVCEAECGALTLQFEKAEKEYAAQTNIAAKHEELVKTRAKLAELKAAGEKTEALRRGLKVLPLCKSASEISAELISAQKKTEDCERELLSVSQNESNVLNEIAALNKKLEDGEFEKRAENCTRLSALYETAAGREAKLTELKNLLEDKRRQYSSKLKYKKNLIAVKDQAERRVNELQSAIADLAKDDLNNLINVQFKGALLRDEYAEQLNYFGGLKGQLNFYKENSELYNFISAEVKQRIKVYSDRVKYVEGFSMDEVKKRLESLQNNDKKKEKLNAELSSAREQLNGTTAEIKVCENELSVLDRDGRELGKQVKDIEDELVGIFGANCKDYSAAVRKNEQEAENIKREKQKITVDVASLTSYYEKLGNERTRLETEKKNEKSNAEKLSAKLDGALKAAGMSLEECKRLVATFVGIEDAEKTVSEYDAQLAAAEEKISSLSAVEGLDNFDESRLKAALEIKNEVAVKLKAAGEELAVKKAAYKRNLERFEEKQKIEKDFISVKQRGELVARLKELTKGNKFMEFIANEYLYDISSLASGTLINLTNGRYFLTYTDNFNVGDNFNGGELRGVNTLSGGETFLVSLSLALALSQTICAKSMKSIEFFFLDEGFGTLDSALVEVVMNALEKLKNSDFTIGIISHVEELKHRIDSKITVLKATESHGSTVQVSNWGV